MRERRLEELHTLIQAWVDRSEADGCLGCEYEDTEEWQDPCARCKRSHKDYYAIKWGDTE